jgi:hypothetical protein
MAEWEKLKCHERSSKAFATLSSRSHDALIRFKLKLQSIIENNEDDDDGEDEDDEDDEDTT